MPNTVACPRCRRKQPVREDAAQYWCDECRVLFDDAPDEGGDYCTDPTRRIERQEEQADRIRRQNRTRARLGRR